VNSRILYLDESVNLWGPPVSIGNGPLCARSIVGILVTSILSEVCYSLIIFCNVLYLAPVTDT
jgi:hypothetical protein